MSTKSLLSLLEEQAIQIPLIQRDYVQGRATDKKEEERRDNFVDTLLKAVNRHSLSLDFIYGTPEAEGFLPLDGQQRLTTLFLLHVLFSVKTGRSEMRARLGRFSYATRLTSTRFCQKLLTTTFSPTANFTAQIEEQYWYDADMKDDPTVQAMMSMLKCMEKKMEAYDYQQGYERLLNQQPITFEHLDMRAFGLTESLYVKMNARGKLLTPFEMWKASFINLLAGDKSTEARFTEGIEHAWHDVFWFYAYREYEQKETAYPRIDERFMNFFHHISRLLFFLQNPEKRAVDYEPAQWKTFESLYHSAEVQQTFFNFLDTLVSLHAAQRVNGLPSFFTSLFYEGESTPYDEQTNQVKRYKGEPIDLFDSLCTDKDFSPNHLLLYALLRYCHQYRCYEATNAHLRDYIRLCSLYLHNLSYFNHDRVAILSAIRVTDMPQYERFFSSLLQHEDPLLAKESLSFFPIQDPALFPLFRKLHDNTVTRGNLQAFLPAIQSGRYTPRIIYEAFAAFRADSTLQRFRKFLQYGYRGLPTKRCLNYQYQALFLGTADDRLEVHFRASENKEAIAEWFSRYLEAFVNHTTPTAANPPQTLCDYLLQYVDDHEVNHYYVAMPYGQQWETLQCVAGLRTNFIPLKGYHYNPICKAVYNRVVKNVDEKHFGCWQENNNALGGIYIYTDPQYRVSIAFLLDFDEERWQIKQEYYDALPEDLQSRFTRQDADTYILLSNNPDVVASAVAFLTDLSHYYASQHLYEF